MRNSYLAFLLILCFAWTPCFGSPIAKVVRRLGDLADNAPVRQMDDLVESAAKANPKPIKIPNKALLKEIDEVLGTAVDPATLKTIKAMDTPSQEVVLQVAKGSQIIKNTIPNPPLRSEFFRDVSGETLIVIGKDPRFVNDAINFKSVIDAKTLKSPEGMRAITFDDFGAFFQKTGERGMKFWNEQIRPNWKLWLGGTALAAVLLAPDDFLNSVGELTEEGFKKIVAFGGQELGAAIKGAVKGIGEGGSKVTEGVIEGVKEGFFSNCWGIITFILLIIGTLIGLWFIPTTRTIMKWLYNKVRSKTKKKNNRKNR